jgi:hypothetical protein
MTTRKQRKQSTTDHPQTFEHRTEIAIYALRHTLKSANHLTLFLIEQLGPNWQELDHLLEAAHSELKQAEVWLAKRKQRSRKR